MTAAEATSWAVRRVRADEWRSAKKLRLDALRDPIAHLAFLERLDNALQQPDITWRARTEAGATGTHVGQFVAVDDRDMFIGSATAKIIAPGEADFLGEVRDVPRADIVAVYVTPEQRGGGVIQRLLSEAEGWLRENGVTQARLHVHEANVRAQQAYLKCGYADTGVRARLSEGVELEMIHPLADGSA
ncbi:GNAT family N-acetyltransferase [Nocardioides panacihumi]